MAAILKLLVLRAGILDGKNNPLQPLEFFA